MNYSTKRDLSNLKKLSYVIIAVASAILFSRFISGCGACSRTLATITAYDKICVDGVSYVQFTSGASVEYDRDGRIKTCK